MDADGVQQAHRRALARWPGRHARLATSASKGFLRRRLIDRMTISSDREVDLTSLHPSVDTIMTDGGAEGATHQSRTHSLTQPLTDY